MTEDLQTAPNHDYQFALKSWLDDRRTAVESALENALRRYEKSVPTSLFEAMAYSIRSGGKRLRPIMAVAAAEAVGGQATGLVLDFACAVEFIHGYSLVHDDLPALDNDDLRRGRPTCHKAFGEAMAILAGDALLTEAFSLLGGAVDLEKTGPASPEEMARRAKLCGLLAANAGAWGMVGGQVDDIRDDRPRSLEALESLHRRKTGALIAVSCAGGGLAAGASPEQVTALQNFGMHLGLSFQIIDDLMDLVSDPRKTGKSKGSDARKGKITYPSLIGSEESLRRARQESALAKAAIENVLPAAESLRALADYTVERER